MPSYMTITKIPAPDTTNAAIIRQLQVQHGSGQFLIHLQNGVITAACKVKPLPVASKPTIEEPVIDEPALSEGWDAPAPVSNDFGGEVYADHIEVLEDTDAVPPKAEFAPPPNPRPRRAAAK